MENVCHVTIPDTVLNRPAGFWDSAVAIDADEVLIKFNALVQKHISARRLARGLEQTINVTDTQTYFYYCDPSTGLGETEYGESLREIALATKGGMGQQTFYEGAIAAVQELKNEGIRPFIVTNVPGALDTSEAHDQRYSWGTAQNLREQQFKDNGLISDSEDLIFCSAHEKPVYMLHKGYHMPILVDDRPSTLVAARWDRGLIAIGIRSEHTKYNQGSFEGVVWFDSLADAVPYIKAVFAELGKRRLLSRSAHINGGRS